MQWFVFDNTTLPKCPYCGSSYLGSLPVLDFYTKSINGRFSSDKCRLMVYNNQYIYPWHVSRNIFPNERLDEQDKKPVGYFTLHKNKWYLVNLSLSQMYNINTKSIIQINSKVELTNGLYISFSSEPDGRAIYIRLVNM
jgi:hypothetical protein